MTTVDTDLRLCSSLDQSADTPGEYLVELVEESRSHPALTHPWLRAMAERSLPDMAWAVRDFAWHYHGYSSWLPQENLNEENGELGAEERATLKTVGIDPETVDGVPHPCLAFLRPEEPPFYFQREGAGYFFGRDRNFEGRIWRRDGESVPVRCVHNPLQDQPLHLALRTRKGS